MKINVILADDHPTLIAGVRHELGNIQTIQIAGTAENSTQIVELLESAPCDVLVTDYAMPGGKYGDGMGLLTFLRRRYPTVKIIVFTASLNAATVREMKKLGVKSVLGKIDDPAHLISAIHAVYSGAAYYSPSALADELQAYDGRAVGETKKELSVRESEVMRLYSDGKTINEIAEQLHRSKQTVSSQKNAAMRKLGVERDADLFKFVFEMNQLKSPRSLGESDES
jgi:two-component system capsular synthesis response regulator RcsB